jgi:hypothetical protein
MEALHDPDPASPPERLSADSARRLAERQRARARQFVRGPIRMVWLESVARLPGKALAVALLLWFLDGFDPGRPVRLTSPLLGRFGIDRKAAYRALKGLEARGLIRLERRPGRGPLIEMVKDAGERAGATG